MRFTTAAALLGLALLAPAFALAAEAPTSGAALYKKYCQQCHGENLNGYAADNAPSLISPTFRATASDDFLHSAIARGRAGTAMAGFGKEYGGPLSEVEIDTLIKFIRGDTKLTPPSQQHATGSRGYGERLFRTHCETCHGTEQKRGNAVHLANPMFLETVNEGYLRVAITDGRPGTPMEPWRDKLSPQEVNDIISYLRSLSRPVPPPPAVATARAAPAIDGAKIVIHPNGEQAEFNLRDEAFVSTADLAKAYDAGKRLIIIDARPNSDYLRMHIEGAISIPYFETKELDKIPNDGTWVITYCACPHHLSGLVREELRKRGYKNTAVLDEGVFEWQRFGHPMFVAPGQLPVAAPPKRE